MCVCGGGAGKRPNLFDVFYFQFGEAAARKTLITCHKFNVPHAGTILEETAKNFFISTFWSDFMSTHFG